YQVAFLETVEPGNLAVAHTALLLGNIAADRPLCQLVDRVGRRELHGDRLADQLRVADDRVAKDVSRPGAQDGGDVATLPPAGDDREVGEKRVIENGFIVGILRVLRINPVRVDEHLDFHVCLEKRLPSGPNEGGEQDRQK